MPNAQYKQPVWFVSIFHIVAVVPTKPKTHISHSDCTLRFCGVDGMLRYSAHYSLLAFSYYFENISIASIQFNSFISHLFDSGLHFKHIHLLPIQSANNSFLDIHNTYTFTLYTLLIRSLPAYPANLFVFFCLHFLPVLFAWLSPFTYSLVVWLTRSSHVSHFRLILIAINVCPQSLISRHNMSSANFVIK